MVSHSDDFGVGTPEDSANSDAESHVDDGIFAQLQRSMMGPNATYVPIAATPAPVAVPEPVAVVPEPVIIEPVTTASIPPVVSQLLEMEKRDQGVVDAGPDAAAVAAPVFADSVSIVEPQAALAQPSVAVAVEVEAEVEALAEPAPVLSRRALREQGKLAPLPRAEEPAEVVAEVAPALELEKVVKAAKPAKVAAAKLAKIKVAKPRAPKVKQPAIVASKVRRTSSVVTMVAMAFIAGLAVATSVPANALLTQAQIHAINAGLGEDGYNVGQEVEGANSAVASGRDKVSATQWGGVLGGGLYSNITYVNNPLGAIQWPFRRTVPISDLFGNRPNPFGTGTSFHHGMDFNPGAGTPIQIIADGVVSSVIQEDFGGLGYNVVVDHNIKGMKFQSVYAHMKAGSIQVKLGQKVSVTDIVGQVGNTGASTGSHLHFEIRIDGQVIDPLTWLQKYAK